MASNRLRRPIPEHARTDGRHSYPVWGLDFVEDAVTGATGADRHLLKPGLLIGGIVRYCFPSITHDRWRDKAVPHNNSRRIYITGEFTGDEKVIPLNKSKRNPVEASAPIFDLQMYDGPYKKAAIGSVAIAWLWQGGRPKVDNIAIDHTAVQTVLDIYEPGSYPNAHIGAVQVGGLFYAVPPEVAGATMTV